MQVSLLWPNKLSAMKVVYFVSKYSVMVDAVLAAASASHVRYIIFPKTSRSWSVVVGSWKPEDPQASLQGLSPHTVALTWLY